MFTLNRDKGQRKNSLSLSLNEKLAFTIQIGLILTT